MLSTFPFPSELQAVSKLGEEYYRYRQSLIAKHQIGLTKIYNRFHDVSDKSSDIVGLRDLHRRLDVAVADAYGWNDIALDHAFYETKQGRRFTVSESARIVVLRRLSELNRQRYEDEVARGLHADSAPRASPSVSRAVQAKKASATRPSLDFESGAAVTANSTPATHILYFLSAHTGWHAKSDILAATGITDGQWNTATADLIACGRIERHGQKRGARYRVAGS